jgi:hypothetical protein
MPSRWIEHVKEFAKKNNMSYGCALSDPNLKKGYVPTGDKKRKPEKLEMATPSTEPKPKNITIKPRAEKSNAYDIVKKILMELDRLDGNYGSDRDPFGFMKDLIIIPEKQGKTKKEIVDNAYEYFETHTNINAKILRSVLMRKLYLELKELKLKNPAPAPAPKSAGGMQEEKTWTDRFKVGDEVLYTYPNSSTRYLAIVRKKTPKSVSIQLDDYDQEGQLLLWKKTFDKQKEVVKSDFRLKKKGDEMNTYSTSSDKDLLFKRGYMSRSDPNA